MRAKTASRRGRPWVVALLAAGLPGAVAFSALAAAPAELPEGCSAGDGARATQYTARAEGLVAEGAPLARVLALLGEMEAGYTPACRAALAREQPTRTRCTREERETVFAHQVAMVGAMESGALARFFSLFEQMEAKVSKACWLAAQQPPEPLVRKLCTPAERDVMAAHVAPAVRATQRMLQTNDTGPLLEVAASQNRQLSRACQDAIQRENVHRTRRTPAPTPDIHDLGGGTLMGPGVACGPRECVVY